VFNIKSPNALELFKVRKTDYPLKHFEYTVIPKTYNLEQSLQNWIKDNSKGRYYIGTVRDKQGQSLKIGFENKKELSYFILACPLLKYR
jgi:hypothetical protein